MEYIGCELTILVNESGNVPAPTRNIRTFNSGDPAIEWCQDNFTRWVVYQRSVSEIGFTLLASNLIGTR